MQASQSLVLTVAALLPAVAAGVFMARRGIGICGAVAVSGSIAILGLVVATGLSLYFASSLNVLLLLIAAPVVGVGLTLALIRRDAQHSATHVTNNNWLVIGVAAGVTVLSFGRQFEYGSFWGDIGVYLSAIEHFAGGGKVSFEVAHSATDLARPDGIPAVLNGINPVAPGLYQFHGLPTWPAFAAIWSQDAAITSVLFGLVVVQFHQLATRLTASPKAALAVTLLLACLPIAWHQALYPTAEMLLLSIVLATILLVSFSGRAAAIPVLVGLLAYGFTHVGILLIAPLAGLAIAAFGLSCRKDQSGRWAQSGLAAAVACLLATGFAVSVSSKYASDIFAALFGGRSWLVHLVAVSPMLGCVPWAIRSLEGASEQKSQAFASFVLARSPILMLLVAVGIVGVVGVQAYLLGWTDHYVPESWNKFNSWSSRVSYVNKGIPTLAHVALLNAALASSIVGLVAFLLFPVDLLRGRAHGSWTGLVLWFSAAYCVLLFCVIRVDITNNYYASRYFLPALTPILLLLAGCWLAPRFKSMVAWVVAVGVCSMYFVSALLGAGFYQGDKWFTQEWLKTAVPEDSVVFFHGSDWLRYFALDRLFVVGGAVGPEPAPGGQAVLLTDYPAIVGGQTDCITYAQRPIPWQISYPTHPATELHPVCAVRPRTASEFNFPSARWLESGKLEFLLAAAPGGKRQEVTVESLGWWSGKAPFKANLEAIAPTLTLCGEAIEAISIEPKRVVFRVQMRQPFCLAKLQTATFVPAEIGEGSDRRKLGMDVVALRSEALP